MGRHIGPNKRTAEILFRDSGRSAPYTEGLTATQVAGNRRPRVETSKGMAA